MKNKLVLAHALLITVTATQSFAAPENQHAHLAPIQQIGITNQLWNTHATGSVPGLTQTAVSVALYNGNTKPCFTATIPFQGFVNVLVGSGQPCVTAVSSVTFTPIAGPSGLVYAEPTATTIDSAYYTNQLIIENGSDPTFDTTNATVLTHGTSKVTYQGQ